MPKISIIMPVYNTEQYLEKTLDSLIAQTFSDIEILCINDGSTDRSGAILDVFAAKDPRVRVFHRTNSGPAATRNIGLNAAVGEFLMFCDSDDWYEPNMCERMYYNITDSNADFAMCDTFVELMTDRPKEDTFYYFPNFSGLKKMSKYVCDRLNILLWNKIFRKSVVDEYGISFPEGLTSDDAAFSYQYFHVARTICLFKEKLYHYVIRAGSVMDNWHRKVNVRDCFDNIGIIEFYYKFIEKNNLFDRTYNMCFSKAVGHIFFTWRNVPEERRDDFIRQIAVLVSKLKIRLSEEPALIPLLRVVESGDFNKIRAFLDKKPKRIGWLKASLRILRYKLLEKFSSPERRRYYRKKLIRVCRARRIQSEDK